MVLKYKLIIFTCVSFIFLSKISHSSQIFDYETEIFLKKLLLSIKSVNEFKKEIKIHIIKDSNPNAFVISKNNLIVSSGLIEQSPDYVALLAVLAHEVGHLEYFHLEKRQDTIEQFSKINMISNLALITGSLLSEEPQMLGGTIASQANINNFYFSFSREQEREADIYSMKTIQNLNLSSDSIKELLKILEKNALNKGYNEDYQKFSTHPIFKERYEIIENNSKAKIFNFDDDLENEFNFIKAKFMAYNNNLNIISLKEDYRILYESIVSSTSGDLKNSLKNINFLINKYPKYIFLLETKGDILRSHGFLNESIKFYEIVLDNYPNNKYIKYKIFLDTNFESLSKIEQNNFFHDHTNLLIQFPKNKYIINKFIEIAINLDKMDWVKFFNIINQKNKYKTTEIKEKLIKISEKTSDKKLKKTIYNYLN